MTKFVRLAALAAVTLVGATPAFAVATGVAVPATTKPTATVTITRPLTLTSDRNLNFGSVAVYASDTITLDATSGLVTCGNTAGNLSCSGSPVTARYKVTGNNNYSVTVNYSATTLDNGTDNLSFTPQGPATVPLTNSGSAGAYFTVGGTVDVDQAVSEGIYSGDMDVTVEY
jgi:spore coat protein U-like protein